MQIRPRPSPIHRQPRRDQIFVQGPLDRSISETSGQLENKPPGMSESSTQMRGETGD